MGSNLRSSVMWAVALAMMLTSSAAWAQVPDPLWSEGRARVDADAAVTFGAFAELASEASPAVVNVSVEIDVRTSVRGGGPRGGFGEGSGFIIHPDGWIVTNHHVIEDAVNISVTLADGREYRAEVVGTDHRTDIALLRIEPDEPLSVLPLGDSSRLRPGEWVVAIGNPFGLDHTVTAGIVSALGRRDITPENRLMYVDYIQTDASVNPGSSGGPLLDAAGNVVGVNAAVNRAGDGIAFAIPIDMVKALLPQLATGAVRRSWLGVSLEHLPANEAWALGLQRPWATVITEVVDGSPADEGGLRAGDVVLSFDGEDIDTFQELPWLASVAGVGHVARVEVLRDDETLTLDVTLGQIEGRTDAPQETGARPEDEEVNALGMTVRNLTADFAGRLGVPDGSGVHVVRVAPESAAERAGIEVDDVVTEVGDISVRTLEQFARAMADLPAGSQALLQVRRDGARVYVGVAVP